MLMIIYIYIHIFDLSVQGLDLAAGVLHPERNLQAAQEGSRRIVKKTVLPDGRVQVLLGCILS